MLRGQARVLLLAAAVVLSSCTYAGKSRTYVPLLRQPGSPEIQKGLEGIVRSNPEAIREIARGRDDRKAPWLRFAVIGDTLSDHNRAYREMLAIMSSLSPAPEFIVHLGDFVANSLESCSYYLETIKDYPRPIIHVRGNHEADGGVARISGEIFGERDFFFDEAGVRFILMGSSRHGMTGSRLEWLEDKLRAGHPSAKIFFSHEFPVEPFEEVFPGIYSLFARKRINEEKLLGLLERYDVPLAFFGHLHRHHQKVYRETVMVISGGGGQRNQLEASARHPFSSKRRHFTLIDLAAVKGAPLQGVITCISRENVPLFMNSFSRRVPEGEASGADGKAGRKRMLLAPYDPSDLELIHPPYLGKLYEAYVRRTR
jgi:predicted phosphodiesterase